MPLGLILTLCGLGIAFLIPASIIIGHFIFKKKRCTEETIGYITDIVTSRSDDGDLMFKPEYEYRVGLETIKTTSGFSSNKLPQMGEHITVWFDPMKPTRSYIEGYENRVVRFLGFLFVFFGLIPIIICVILALTWSS